MPVAFLASAARRFFVEAGDALAPLELREHVFRTQALALEQYQATRRERTARAQLTSRQNSWGKGVTDTDWVYGYNAWTAPLARP